MRAVLVLAAASLALAACGAEERSGGGPASTSAADAPTRSVSEEWAESQRPPEAVLVSDAGEQAGVQGSSCVGNGEVLNCGYGPPLELARLSVVRPGEELHVVLRGTTSLRGDAVIIPLGCDDDVRRFALHTPATSWKVDLDPGLYRLDLFTRFEAPGKGGDTSVAFGLQVDPDAEPAIVPAPAELPACLTGQSR